MEDTNIVKALECCIETSGVNCGKCPYCDNCITDENTSLMMTDTLDLINRQKAENERLKTNLNIELENYATEYDNKIKTEAYREFAERLKEKKARYNADNFYVIDYIPSKEVDNLLKELVGDDDG